MYKLKTNASFDSAHFLAGYDGKCANIHGHTWNIEVTVSGEELISSGQERGMLIDFSELKKLVRSIADSLDHTFIYETGSLRDTTVAALESEGFKLTAVAFRPTAENFARYISDRLTQNGLPVSSVTVYETKDNCAVYEVEK